MPRPAGPWNYVLHEPVRGGKEGGQIRHIFRCLTMQVSRCDHENIELDRETNRKPAQGQHGRSNESKFSGSSQKPRCRILDKLMAIYRGFAKTSLKGTTMAQPWRDKGENNHFQLGVRCNSSEFGNVCKMDKTCLGQMDKTVPWLMNM